MTKKHFIELAEIIRRANYLPNGIPSRPENHPEHFTGEQIELLADFCASVNPAFNRERWIDYIEGRCGPSGGKIA